MMTELKPLTSINVQVPSSPTHTIDLINSDAEEGGNSPVPVPEEVDNGNNLQTFMNLFRSSMRKYSSIP